MEQQGNIKSFSLRDVLTVTTGRLLTESKGPGDNGIGNLYALLGHMTGDSPFTHQLGRFGEECRPWLFRWFPELKAASGCLSKLDEWSRHSQDGPETGIFYWLAELKTLFPDIKDEYEIGQIPRDDHDVKHPYDELVAMRGTDEGIVPIVL